MSRAAAALGLSMLLAACSDATGAAPDFGALLLRTTLSLVAVCALAVVSLRWFAARTRPASAPGQRMEVLERLPLGPRRGLVAVRVADRVLVLAEDGDRTRAMTELPLGAWRPDFAALVDDDRTGAAAALVDAGSGGLAPRISVVARNIDGGPTDPVQGTPADSPSPDEIVA